MIKVLKIPVVHPSTSQRPASNLDPYFWFYWSKSKFKLEWQAPRM